MSTPSTGSSGPARPAIAWIGLGIMGFPMAENLITAGYPVTGFTRKQEKLDRFARNGGTSASSIAEAVRDADVVITMVPADPQVKAVVLGEDGVIANARPGTTIIDMSSVTPQTSVAVAEAAAGAGKDLKVLDAPVSGSEAGAIEAVLSIMVGGDQSDFDRMKPAGHTEPGAHPARQLGPWRAHRQARQPKRPVGETDGPSKDRG
jgi:2-hydroxy-3-oxopropionate reductase